MRGSRWLTGLRKAVTRTALAAAWPALVVLALWLGGGVALRLWLRDFAGLASQSGNWISGGGSWGVNRTGEAIVTAVQILLAVGAFVSVGCVLVAGAARRNTPQYSRGKCMRIGLGAWPGVLTVVVLNAVLWTPALIVAVVVANNLYSPWLRPQVAGAIALAVLTWLLGARLSLWPMRLAERPQRWGVALARDLLRMTTRRTIWPCAVVSMPAGAAVALIGWLKRPDLTRDSLSEVGPWLLLAGVLLWIGKRSVFPLLHRAYAIGRERLALMEGPLGKADDAGADIEPSPHWSLPARRPRVGFALLVVVPALLVVGGLGSVAWWMTPMPVDAAWYEAIRARQQPVESAEFEQWLADAEAAFSIDPYSGMNVGSQVSPVIRQRYLTLRPAVDALLARWKQMADRPVGFDRLGQPIEDAMRPFSALRPLHQARAAFAETPAELAAVLGDAIDIAQHQIRGGVAIDVLIALAVERTALRDVVWWVAQHRATLTLDDLAVLDRAVCGARLDKAAYLAALEREALVLYDQWAFNRQVYADGTSSVSWLDRDLRIENTSQQAAAILAALPQHWPQPGTLATSGRNIHSVNETLGYVMTLKPLVDHNDIAELVRMVLRVEAEWKLSGAVPATLAAISAAAWNLPGCEPLILDPAVTLTLNPAPLAWVGPGEFQGRVDELSTLGPVNLPPGVQPAAALQLVRGVISATGPDIREPDWTTADPLTLPTGPVEALQVLDMLATALHAVLMPDYDAPGSTWHFAPDDQNDLPQFDYLFVATYELSGPVDEITVPR